MVKPPCLDVVPLSLTAEGSVRAITQPMHRLALERIEQLCLTALSHGLDFLPNAAVPEPGRR